MTERDLVEAAARSIGDDRMGGWDAKGKYLTDYEGWYFDPLKDDADAMRLVVRLGMRVDVLHGAASAGTQGSASPSCED